jgi:hypothetical protein
MSYSMKNSRWIHFAHLMDEKHDNWMCFEKIILNTLNNYKDFIINTATIYRIGCYNHNLLKIKST